MPPLGISANFNGFLYIFDFILFQNKNKNHHISIVLYSMNNVSTAVYCMLVLLWKDIVMRAVSDNIENPRQGTPVMIQDTPPYQNISTIRPKEATLP